MPFVVMHIRNYEEESNNINNSKNKIVTITIIIIITCIVIVKVTIIMIMNMNFSFVLTNREATVMLLCLFVHFLRHPNNNNDNCASNNTKRTLTQIPYLGNNSRGAC